jgi:hypothetical protein
MNIEPLLGWLALGSGVLGLSSGAYATFDVIGKPRIGARMQWVRVAIIIAVIVPVALVVRSEDAIALARLIVATIFVPSLLFAVGREMNVSFEEYIASLWRPVAAASAMSAVLYVMNTILPPGPLRFALDIVSGVVVFLASLVLAWHGSGRPAGPEVDVWKFFIAKTPLFRAVWRW